MCQLILRVFLYFVLSKLGINVTNHDTVESATSMKQGHHFESIKRHTHSTKVTNVPTAHICTIKWIFALLMNKDL